MAPFVIKHPKLIHQWVNQFEKTLDIIKKNTHIKKDKIEKYITLLLKSQMYLSEVLTTDKLQKKKNNQSHEELSKIIDYCKNTSLENFNWSKLINYAENNVSFDTQEILKVQIIELYPGIADPLAENMSISDDLSINTDSKVSDLIEIIEKNYSWAININFKEKNNNYLFWYVSEEKLEPRLGERYNEKGADLEQPLGIGKMVNELYNFILINLCINFTNKDYLCLINFKII